MDRVIRSCSIYDREPKDIRCKRDTSLNSDKSCISKHIYRAVNCSHKQACLSINCRSTSIRKKNDQMTKSALPYGIFWVSVNAGDTLNVAVNGILNSIKGESFRNSARNCFLQMR
ncbi:hypothetical protein GJ496_007374 [Pomphorhynchus laevis]|nr:hypothetical protein GJ496_007374 [Pomphorhynchus laevis]